MAAIFSLYIINKSGGLIYYKDYGSAGRMDTNNSLWAASLWHSMHAISQQLLPVSGCSGIELLQADTFDLHCFQSLAGTKFFVVCEPGTQQMESLLKFIYEYELYTNYVLKNTFYEMEMPIRCELCDINLGSTKGSCWIVGPISLYRWLLAWTRSQLGIRIACSWFFTHSCSWWDRIEIGRLMISVCILNPISLQGS